MSHYQIFEGLEKQFYAELNLPRIEGGCETQRFGRTCIAAAFNTVAGQLQITENIVHAGKIHAVEEIERFEQCLHAVSRIGLHVKIFRDTDIKSDQVRPQAGISSGEGGPIRVRVRVIVRIETQ
jgi:hypothetical protein